MTLIELVVSISILSILATLSFSKDNLDKHYINSFVKQMSSDIRYVRKSNMLGDLKTNVYIKKEQDIYSYTLRIRGKDIKEIKLPKNTYVICNQNKIVFKKDGSPLQNGQTIQIKNKDINKKITIVPISGRVLIKEGKYET